MSNADVIKGSSGGQYRQWKSPVRDVLENQLPKPNRLLLEQLIAFLHLVSTHCTVNKMTTSNLAIVSERNKERERQS